MCLVCFSTKDFIVFTWFSFVLLLVVGADELDLFELCKICGVSISVSKVILLFELD